MLIPVLRVSLSLISIEGKQLQTICKSADGLQNCTSYYFLALRLRLVALRLVDFFATFLFATFLFFVAGFLLAFDTRFFFAGIVISI